MKKRILLLIAAMFMLFSTNYSFANLSKSGGTDEWISIESGSTIYSNAQLPFNFTFSTSVVQVIYSADLIGKDECTMQGLKYFYTNNTADVNNKNVKVYIAPTMLTNLEGGWIPQEDFTLVFDGNVSLPKNGVGSELDIDFTTPYLYTGGNICIMTVREMDVNTTTNVTGFNLSPTNKVARFYQDQSTPFNFTQPGTNTNRMPKARIKVQGQPAAQEEWISIGDGTMKHSQFPFNFTFSTSAVQTIYAANLINMNECKLTGAKYFYSNNTADVVDKNVKVYIAPTTLTNLEGGWIPKDNFTLVFDGKVSLPKNGDNSELDINFTTPYLYTGGNICIMTIKDFDINTTANVSGFNSMPIDKVTYYYQNQYTPFDFTQPGSAINRMPNLRLKAEIQPAPTTFTVLIPQPHNGTIEVKNGEQTINNGDVVPGGTTLSFNAIPATGYNLINKYVDGTVFEGNSFNITKSVLLSAEFAINKYTVAWNEVQNGTLSVKNGAANVANGSKVDYNTVLTIALTANAGYALTSLTVNDTPFVSGQTYTVTGDVNIQSEINIKKYAVSWVDPKGGVISVFDGETSIQNGTLIDHFTSLIISLTASEGYDPATLTVNDIEFENNSSVTVTIPLSITATTSLIDYTITYSNVNGATNNNPTTYTVETDTIELQALSINGYTFEGWYDNSEYNGTAITQIALGSIGNKHLYAKWSLINYTITYNNANGATNSNPTSYDIETSTITLNPLTINGHAFEGWFDNAGFTGNAITEIVKGSTGDKQFYAKWSLTNYTITYNNVKGATNSNPVTYTIETATIELHPLTLNGYTFEGWFDNVELTGNAITQIVKGATGNKQLYAKWTLINYSITYVNVNGATNNNPTTYNVETPTIQLQSLSIDGYTFEGWFDNADLIDNPVTEITQGSIGNKELYAMWKVIKFTITATAGDNGTVSPETATVDYGKDVTFTFTPNTDSVVNSILIDGEEVEVANSYTFTHVKANHTIHVTFRKPEGVNDLDNSRVSIFANGKNIAIQATDSDAYQYQIIDINGRLISDGQFDQNANIAVEKQGVYIVRIIAKGIVIEATKLICR